MPLVIFAVQKKFLIFKMISIYYLNISADWLLSECKPK